MIITNRLKNLRTALLFSVLFSASPLTAQSPAGFSVQPLDDSLVAAMVAKNAFGPHSPVPAERLRLVSVRYYGFDARLHDGRLVVLDACSGQVKRVFEELLDRKFALQQVELITAYDGSDSLSMAANNTSAHNLRPVTGGQRFSLHSYGTAIDINPVQNPYIDISCDDSLGIARFQPAAGIRYANRHENRPGKVNRKGMAEAVVDVFAAHGFYTWGGHWNCPIDYQHFQLSRSLTELLVTMPTTQATAFYRQAVAYYNRHKSPIETVLERRSENRSLAALYEADPEQFLKLIDELD